MRNTAIKLAIAISSFRSDDQVVALVRSIVEQGVDFDWLFVVESEADGTLEGRLAALGDPRVRYYSVTENIGSAGNLARRLLIAEELGADWMFALNHDAPMSVKMLSALLDVAANAEVRVGALYPLRFEQGRGQYCMTGCRKFLFGFGWRGKPPTAELTKVYWGSSNAALYSLSPIREGLRPEASLWMGWEDYLYGLDLDRKNWHQWVIRDAEIHDTYEYRDDSFGGFKVVVSDKPCWYYYYAVRNLLLVHLHLRPSIRGLVALVAWIPVYVFRVLAFPGRCSRATALRNLAVGAFDGLKGKRGKWRLP